MASRNDSRTRTCNHCSKENVPCKMCSRCCVTYYCSKECQLNNYECHKDNCCTVGTQWKVVEQKEKQLQSLHGGGYFRGMVGYLWGLTEPRSYCVARFELADDMLHMGIGQDNPYAYEAALAHQLDLIRLSINDDQRLRDHIPFVLLLLNRLEDCYDFIKWWAIVDRDDSYDWDALAGYKEGEWIYLRNQDIKEDLFKDRRVGNARSFNHYHLLALVLLKIMLIRDMEKSVDEAKAALLTGPSARSGSNLPVVKIADQHPLVEHYMEVNKGLLEQRQIVKKYCSILNKISPTILKAAVNYQGPLLSLRMRGMYDGGPTVEPHEAISTGVCAFKKTGADNYLRQIYGNKFN